jgi:hypothetical protein
MHKLYKAKPTPTRIVVAPGQDQVTIHIASSAKGEW